MKSDVLKSKGKHMIINGLFSWYFPEGSDLPDPGKGPVLTEFYF